MPQKDYGGNCATINDLKVYVKPNASSEYVMFPTPDNDNNTQIIGVNEGNWEFEFRNSGQKTAIAIYIDESSIKQKAGVIKDPKSIAIDNHKGNVMYVTNGISKLDCYVTEKAPRLTFTNDWLKQISTYLGGKKGVITIYTWVEGQTMEEEEVVQYRSIGAGVGEDTHTKFQTTSKLSNPVFMGLCRIYYTNAVALSHLGETIVSESLIEEPFDVLSKIPKS